MAADEAREDACRDYQSSLEDLTFNSKPHINMLTILAEENVQFARDIVTLIEAQIAKHLRLLWLNGDRFVYFWKLRAHPGPILTAAFATIVSSPQSDTL